MFKKLMQLAVGFVGLLTKQQPKKVRANGGNSFKRPCIHDVGGDEPEPPTTTLHELLESRGLDWLVVASLDRASRGKVLP